MESNPSFSTNKRAHTSYKTTSGNPIKCGPFGSEGPGLNKNVRYLAGVIYQNRRKKKIGLSQQDEGHIKRYLTCRTNFSYY
jgi:hypothetical protein